MKTVIRVIALSSIVPAIFAGSALQKPKAAEAEKTVAIFRPSTVPGPVPTCNPLTQTCPNIRSK